jgi:hypothetical protein
MCGLVGVLTKGKNGLLAEHNDVFDELLFIDQLRGDDATGVFTVTNRGEVLLAKESSDATNYRRSKEYDQLLKRAFRDGAALIGHNRKATRGWLTDENAHPFVVDDRIVLVHNGGVKGDHKKFHDTEVDSEAIARHIHKYDGDVQKAMSEIEAAYALIWYDFEKATMNFLRNSERPLWWMETENCYYWCSERSMLNFVTDRYNIKVKTAPTSLEVDTLLTFSLNTENNWPMWKLSHQKLSFEKPKVAIPFDRGGGGTADLSGDDAQAAWERFKRNNQQASMLTMDGKDDFDDDIPFELHPLERLRPNVRAQLAAGDRDTIIVNSNVCYRDGWSFQDYGARGLSPNEYVLCGGTVYQKVTSRLGPLDKVQNREEVVQQIKRQQLPVTTINQEALDKALKGIKSKDVNEKAKAVFELRHMSGGTTQEREAKMFEKTGRGLEYQLFRQIYQPAYPWGIKVLAQPFDFGFANGKNKEGGFYLYSAVVNDNDAVVRHFWEERFMDEERLVNMCEAGDYVYKFSIGSKRFIPFDYPGWDGETSIAAGAQGGCLIISDRAELMFGGGTGDKSYQPKKLEEKVHQGQVIH